MSISILKIVTVEPSSPRISDILLFNTYADLAEIFIYHVIMYCFFQGELSSVDQLEDRNHLPAYTSMLEALSVKIDRISCEVIKKLPKQYSRFDVFSSI
jgi:hypothetical protein